MRRITVFDDNDFELLASENNFNIDAKKEWKQFIKNNKLESDLLLDYWHMIDLILLFNGSPIDDNDKAYEIIHKYEKEHPEKFEKLKNNPHHNAV